MASFIGYSAIILLLISPYLFCRQDRKRERESRE